MTAFEQRILDMVRSSLGNDQLANTIVYLNWNPICAGEHVKVGDALIKVPWDAYIAFVDLEPGVNWGHACCYLAIREDADEVIKVAARIPPFLKDKTLIFRLLWRGPLAPEWAVATDPN